MDKKQAFTLAIKENQGLVYKVATLYTDTLEDRNDLVQDIVYQLWKSFDSFDNRAKLSTWMYRVAMNVAIYRMKIRKRAVQVVPLTESINATAETVPDDYEEKWKILRTQLDKLNLLEKGLVMLYLEGKNYAEIAQIVGISESNVGTKISRIKEKLRSQIVKNYSTWN